MGTLDGLNTAANWPKSDDEVASTFAVNDFSSGDISWVLTSTAFVFIMTPGLGLFYAGFGAAKNVMTMLTMCALAMCIVSLQWLLFGFSLAFSPTAENWFIGDFGYAGLFGTNSVSHPLAPTIPVALFALYQMMFAAITPALAIGSTAGRLRVLPMCVMALLWSTLVYDPVTYWIWCENGFLHDLKVLDYAGGTVVHVTSAMCSLALTLLTGPGKTHVTEGKKGPHSPLLVYIGTSILWFGWMGFNGGSALAGNSRAAYATLATHVAACAGALTWMALDCLRSGKRVWSGVALCTGAVAGLATVTPGSGYVSPMSGMWFGIIGAGACRMALEAVEHYKLDDTLDVLAIHGVGGATGMLLTGILAEYSVTLADVSDPSTATAGWVSGVWVQLPVQMLAIFCAGTWSFLITYGLGRLMNSVPMLRLRCDQDAEERGLDVAEVGEAAYSALSSKSPDAILTHSAAAKEVSATANEQESISVKSSKANDEKDDKDEMNTRSKYSSYKALSVKIDDEDRGTSTERQ